MRRTAGSRIAPITVRMPSRRIVTWSAWFPSGPSALMTTSAPSIARETAVASVICPDTTRTRSPVGPSFRGSRTSSVT